MDNWLLDHCCNDFYSLYSSRLYQRISETGISLLSTVLTLVIVLLLSPYVADALAEFTPVDDFIEKKTVEAFMPEIPTDQIAQLDLSGTPLEDLTPEQLA